MATATNARSLDEIEETLREYETTLRSYVGGHPLTAVAAAFAAGYVLGGGLTPRLSWIALNAVGRMALVNLLRDLTLGRPAIVPASTANGG
jgi:hypothetical protein